MFFSFFTLASIGFPITGFIGKLFVIVLVGSFHTVAPFAVLSALNRKSLFAVEGAMKYFLLNAFSSAILLYGIVLIFGSSGSFELQQIFF